MALVLTRNVGESIIIGDEVVITISAVQGNRVKLGIKAPKEVSVHREEVYERILREEKRQVKRM